MRSIADRCSLEGMVQGKWNPAARSVVIQLVVTIGVQFRDCGSSLMGTPMGFAMLSNFQTSSFGICYAIKLPDFVYQLEGTADEISCANT